MNIHRTPDERFPGLPGYPFTPHYAEVAGLHCLDEGARIGRLLRSSFDEA